MDNKGRDEVLKSFAMVNESDITQISLSTDEIKLRFKEDSHSKVDDILDGLVLDLMCLRTFEFSEEKDEYVDYYSLTKKGTITLKRLYGIEQNDNSKVENIYKVIHEFKISNINLERKSDYINALTEMSDCFSVDCYNATISLCGKIIEIYLTELLNHFQVKIERSFYDERYKNNRSTTDLTLGQLYRLTERLPDGEKATYINSQNIELIKLFRNGTVHYKEKIPIPSKDQTEGIISFTLDALKRRLSYNW